MAGEESINSAGRLIIKLLVNTLAVVAAAYVLPGVRVDGFGAAVLTAVILGVVNTFLKPLLVILTLPITILTLGLFLLILNALLILLVSVLVPGFEVVNIWWAILFSIVLSLVGGWLEILSRR